MSSIGGRIGVVDMILQGYRVLSDAEKTVADFMLKHKGAVSSLSAVEIAKRSRVSNTTVSRFVRSIGYPSFSEMRYALAREEAAGKTRPFDESSGISFSDIPGTMRCIMETKVDELEGTLASLDIDSVERAVGAAALPHKCWDEKFRAPLTCSFPILAA